jgi:diadenosine tetraphosphate (Ap4A) HIT family hydrolase
MQLRNETAMARQFIGDFDQRLIDLKKTKGLPPGMLIAILANENFHGRAMPATVFSNLDYTQPWETPEDPEILSHAMRHVKNGFVNIEPTLRVNEGPYVLQYNFVRGFRPKRSAAVSTIPLQVGFDEAKFNYAIPEVEPEVFHNGRYGEMNVDFILNRYPFAPYHFLFVPERTTGKRPQYLHPQRGLQTLQAAREFLENAGDGAYLCYNANGGHASVNHLHLQGFFCTKDWQPPIEKILAKYDLSKSQTIDDAFLPGTRWIGKQDTLLGVTSFIEEMHTRNDHGEKSAYHLAMTTKGTLCFPRKHQGDAEYMKLLQAAEFTSGFAVFEMLGEIISPTKAISTFDATQDRIKKLYCAAAL